MESSEVLSQDTRASEEQSLKRKKILTDLITESKDCQEKLKQRPTKESLGILTSILEKCNSVRNEGKDQDRVHHSSELVLDAHVISISHQLVSTIFEDVSQFNEQTFANSILNIVNNNNWNELLKISQPISRTVHVASSMLGAIESHPKLSVARQRQRRSDALTAEQKPETFDKLNRSEKGAEKVNIARKIIVNYLRTHGVDSIPFYKLIIDPSDFMKTADNAFQLAFMVKEKTVYISQGSDGYPAVTLTKSNKNITTNECECALTFALVQKFIEFYNIEDAILKYDDL
ncbi:uncharacterized protein LOC119671614 isoform X2 [Teleopsis dalmanni]|uniref:uncharacterized protein LOC119671614 isoform X2 n=1 Tax=Teleopsis dalmanni TaxID=139649 RepID=UPI000D32B26C|nr:uncharacterized protein LOC119671614 isoform X2 [Teleopsis dalmanni]